jgi:hypothetical protein
MNTNPEELVVDSRHFALIRGSFFFGFAQQVSLHIIEHK